MSPETFWLLLWGRDSDLHEVKLPEATCWIPCPDQRALVRLLDVPGCEVSLVPRNKPDPWGWYASHLLWCHLRTGEAQRQLEAFRPAPTIVLREGRTLHRWALWSLSRPLCGSWVERATARLSYRLRGLRRAGMGDTLIPSPFTGQTWTEYETTDVYSPRQIVGHLREAPDPNGWRAERRPAIVRASGAAA